jgi:hypothetical protein
LSEMQKIQKRGKIFRNLQDSQFILYLLKK